MTVDPDWIVPDWPVPARVRAFVTTRRGGVSVGPWGVPPEAASGMNIGRSAGDADEAVAANRARLRACLPADPFWLHQVHGAQVVDADAGDSPVPEVVPKADASVAARAGTVCAVQMADCLPVLLVDEHARAVGAAHAGWRGLAGGVIQNTVRALRRRAGDDSARVFAWLGPAIGPRSFEVGADVLDAMRASLPDAEHAFVPLGERPHGGKYLADLYALARQALKQVGVHQAWGGHWCTYAEPERFYSYRRDRVTGRHVAVIWLDS